MPSNLSVMRPGFLTTICILTFLGSGGGIERNIKTYLHADERVVIMGKELPGAEDKRDAKNACGFVKSVYTALGNVNADWLRESCIIELISNVLTLVGAILMWKLRKTGFYIYILGMLVLILSPLVLGNAMFTEADQAFIGLIFIAMYGANLKQMNNKGIGVTV